MPSKRDEPLNTAAFLQRVADYRDEGYRFLGMQTNCQAVSYLFDSHKEGGNGIVFLVQQVEEETVASIALLFPLADFPERQMYRDCRVKALGNINLVPREV